jgi:hypothetical protein
VEALFKQLRHVNRRVISVAKQLLANPDVVRIDMTDAYNKLSAPIVAVN